MHIFMIKKCVYNYMHLCICMSYKLVYIKIIFSANNKYVWKKNVTLLVITNCTSTSFEEDYDIYHI